MENIKSCGLCLKQIIKTENFENLHCDDKRNLKILKNEITVSKDAIICSNCVNISHLMYNFKMSCLTNNDHLKTLIHPGINEKLILEEVVVEETKSEFKNEKKVCRFCLNFSEVNSLVEVNQEQDVVLKDMLRRCLPEIDTNIVQNPLICSICSELLEKLFNFFSQCEDTEVLRNLDTKTDILVNENIATVTVKNNEDNIDNGFVKEEICEGIKNSELQIKSEDFDIGEDIKDSINESNCRWNEREIQKGPSSFSSDLFRCKVCFHQTDSRMSLLTHQQTHWTTGKSTRSEFCKCTEYSFQSKYQSSLVRHKKDCKTPCGNCKEEKVELYKCNMCNFVASNKREIVKHKKKDHKDRKRCLDNPVEEKDVKATPTPHGTTKEKKFACDICSYQTNINNHLKRHCLVHKEPSEVNVFKCDDCHFASKWKKNLIEHAIRHKNPSELPKFKCNDCPYETNIRRYLAKHAQLHKLLEVNGFKCDYCPFATANKHSLIEHAIRHKNPSELPKFKCNDCTYETNIKKYLIAHVLVHKSHSQVNMYKCKVCSFRTKYKKSILLHEKNHQVEIYTCDKCNYKSKFKRSLMLHLRNHREWKPTAKSSQNLKEVRQYKCNECSYVGTHSHLIQHQRIHKDFSEREMYNCTECSFQALYKSSLKIHYKKNHSNSKIPFGELKTSM